MMAMTRDRTNTDNGASVLFVTEPEETLTLARPLLQKAAAICEDALSCPRYCPSELFMVVCPVIWLIIIHPMASCDTCRVAIIRRVCFNMR